MTENPFAPLSNAVPPAVRSLMSVRIVELLDRLTGRSGNRPPTNGEVEAMIIKVMEPYVKFRDDMDRAYVKYRDEVDKAKIRAIATIEAMREKTSDNITVTVSPPAEAGEKDSGGTEEGGEG